MKAELIEYSKVIDELGNTVEIEIPATFPLNLPPVIIREKFNYNFRPGYSYVITINVMTADMSVNSHIVSWEYKVVEDLEIETKY